MRRRTESDDAGGRLLWFFALEEEVLTIPFTVYRGHDDQKLVERQQLPRTHSFAAVTAFTVAVLAGIPPARRGAAVQPLEAIRAE